MLPVMKLNTFVLFASVALCACRPTTPNLRSPNMNQRRSPSPSPTLDLRRTGVLDSFMTFRETGNGPDIVFLHGNPLSSYVWRRVLPKVAPRGRCLAPDLIGMGDSGKPDIGYRFSDHARYLDAWFEALGLRDVVLVGYDWGGVLAMDWAARHPERTRGLVLFETFMRPMQWSEWSPKGAELFRNLRTPGVGETLAIEANQLLDRSLKNGIARGVSEDDRAIYEAPYAQPAARRPLLQWTREIPIEGQPADMVAVFARFDTWLAASPGVPKLLLRFDSPSGLQPSPTGSTAMIEWARAHVAGIEISALGNAGHHAPEDRPGEIADAISSFLTRHSL